MIPQGFQNIDSFYYALLSAVCYQLKNKKNECQNDELKKDTESDQLYDALSAAKEKLRLNLDSVFLLMICWINMVYFWEFVSWKISFVIWLNKIQRKK